jgi:hypothetical protein
VRQHNLTFFVPIPHLHREQEDPSGSPRHFNLRPDETHAQILSKIHDETQKTVMIKTKHNLKRQKNLTFYVGLGRSSKLPAKFENFQRFPTKWFL